MDNTNNIRIKVTLDDNKLPEKIEWELENQQNQQLQDAKAIIMAFWDRQESTTLRLDLWTKDMRVDEMGMFFFQTLLTLSQTYQKSVPNSTLHKEIEDFANSFNEKMKKEIMHKK